MKGDTFFVLTMIIGLSLFLFGLTQPNPCDEILKICTGFCSCSPAGNFYEVSGSVMFLGSFFGLVFFYVNYLPKTAKESGK